VSIRTGARKRIDAHVAGEARRNAPIAAFITSRRGDDATRLSTAFDSTTLYGEDPDLRPDVFGRTGNSGVSIATLDDMKKLYSGFDLCKPSTSVSMTINGPAPMILAMFMNTAIDQRVERHLRTAGRWPEAEAALGRAGIERPEYRGDLPAGHDGSGLGLLGVTGRKLVELGVLDADAYATLRAEALSLVRGTVQADILKEDQAQNTCIFSTEFALRDDGRRAAVLQREPRAQLLLGVDLRLSHRRSRREPGHAARLHARQRLSPSSSTTWRAA
jgi:methylmalonyl-CoA mutase